MTSPSTPEDQMRAAAARMVAARCRQPGLYFVPMVMEAWRELEQWFRDVRHDAAESRRIADLALAVMTDYATLPPSDVEVLAKSDTGWRSEMIADLVKRDKAAARQSLERLWDSGAG